MAAETFTLAYNIRCSASLNGSSDELNSTPEITFSPATGCGATAAAGPTTGPEAPKAELAPVAPPPEINITGWIQADKKCEKEKGETPWNSPQDCLKNIWELDKVFCLPLFNCGNWGEAWWINGMIVLVAVGLGYFMYKSKKIKRPI